MADEAVEAPAIHVLHAVVDAGLGEEGTVEVDDLGSGSAVQYFKLDENGVKFGVVEFEPNFLAEGIRMERVTRW